VALEGRAASAAAAASAQMQGRGEAHAAVLVAAGLLLCIPCAAAADAARRGCDRRVRMGMHAAWAPWGAIDRSSHACSDGTGRCPCMPMGAALHARCRRASPDTDGAYIHPHRSMYNNIRTPGQLQPTATFYLFKSDIDPKWEDPKVRPSATRVLVRLVHQHTHAHTRQCR
jgi:hypothetical protein